MRSAVSAPADAKNQLDTLGPDRAPSTSRAPPIRASRYPMDRRRSRAVGSLAGRCDQRSWARSGATRNEIPEAARTAPATTAALFTTRVYTRCHSRADVTSAWRRNAERSLSEVAEVMAILPEAL